MPPEKRAAGQEPFDERVLRAGDRDRLATYRASYPPRALRVTRHHFGRPNRTNQEAWGLYTRLAPGKVPKVQVQHFCPTLLVPVPASGGGTARVGNEPALFRVQGFSSCGDDVLYEHYTSIHRIWNLAVRHPLVGNVIQKTQQQDGGCLHV